MGIAFARGSGDSITLRQLFIVRHAQSANNALPEEHRVSDPGLTPLGHLQAMRLATRMQAVPIQRIYTSGFLRALETARYMAAAKKMMVRVQQDLFEQGGCYAGYREAEYDPQPGMGRGEIARRYPNWEIDPRIEDAGWWFGQPYESEAMARQRAAQVASWLLEQALEEDDRIALVIHGDFKRLLLAALRLDPAEDADPPNTSVTHLVWNQDGWHPKAWYCTEHLTSS